MRRYFLGIGSNIAPRDNVPAILEALLESYPALEVSRIVRTPPVGPMESGGDFLNLAVSLESDEPIDTLIARCRAIEVALGRDRDDPQRKRRGRPADLDLLFELAPEARRVDGAALPAEPFLRPLVIELLDWMGIAHGAPPVLLPSGEVVLIGGRQVGAAPGRLTNATLRGDAP